MHQHSNPALPDLPPSFRLTNPRSARPTPTRDGVLSIKVAVDSQEPVPQEPPADGAQQEPRYRIHRVNCDSDLVNVAVTLELEFSDINIPNYYAVTTDEDDE